MDDEDHDPSIGAVTIGADDPKPPLVVVEWEDATNVASWEDYDEAVAFERLDREFHCTNVGYLIRDDEECVIVAARATTDFVAVGLFERIPRGMVQRVIHLQPVPGRRPSAK